MECSTDATKQQITRHLSDILISFDNIEKFPSTQGLYFVFLEKELVYIGKADKQTIQDRCKQYINKSSGGTLRKK